jgi:SAM-dependent methyltransferase
VAASDNTDLPAAPAIRNFSTLAKDEAARERIIIEMPAFIRQKAQLISAHFLLPAGSRIVDMGCETGEVTYMLAALNPRTEIIGVDASAESIDFARKTYRLPNLSFRVDDISIPGIENESVDGIVNSNILHYVYSLGGYDAEGVAELLEKQVRKLKTGGTMLIRDYVQPPEGEMVMLELPNVPSQGKTPAELSDADLLVSFSQTARPMITGSEGFFIEELMPRREGTRLFRLPHKWAVEFIHRKDYRADWQRGLRQEYTFFTLQDYRRELMHLGLRMVFSSPHWNPWVVKNRFEGHFQLYDTSYVPLDPPATNHFIVAQKVGDRQSLVLEERRPSQQPAGELQILMVRDKKSGAVHEIVKRAGEYCDIVPWRKTADGRIVVYVRGGYPRPIVNAVLRGSNNLDGKKWSGHLVEPVTMDTSDMTADIDTNRKMIFGHLETYAGLKPKDNDSWYVGETYFPAPDRIDEAIEPVFIEVENPQKTSWPITQDKDIRFTEIGTITELDATDIVLASQVGLLPEPRLELHVFDLLWRNGLPPPPWLGEPMPSMPAQSVRVYEPAELLKDVEPAEFEDVKGDAIHLRAVRSVFVEEGKVGRTTRGMSAQDIEFIVTEEGIENVAVIVPLSRDWDHNLLVAVEPKVMPVPNRMDGNGATMNVPSFVLPAGIKSVREARGYIAKKFNVPIENVGRLGESYFAHTGITPQRVYPFFITSAREAEGGQKWKYSRADSLVKLLWRTDPAYNNAGTIFVKAVARLQMMASENHDLSMVRSPVNLKNKGLSLSTEKVAVETKSAVQAAPSRVLGQSAASSGAGGGAKKRDSAPLPVSTVQAGNTAEDALARANKVAQAAVENVVAPRIGKRLTQSYAQALGLQQEITLVQTPSVAAVDKGIDEVGDKIRKARMLDEQRMRGQK